MREMFLVFKNILGDSYCGLATKVIFPSGVCIGICHWVETNGGELSLGFMDALFMKKSAPYNAPK